MMMITKYITPMTHTTTEILTKIIFIVEEECRKLFDDTNPEVPTLPSDCISKVKT